MDVFQAFASSEYVYLKINRGGVAGNLIVSQTPAEGVFKLRSGMTVSNDQETKTSDATLHIRPHEEFLANNSGNLIGHGIRCQGRDYEIVGQTGGQNFETGDLEHYRVTLQATDFSDYAEAA